MNKEKILFMCVDAQKDFINKDGALSVKGAEKIKPALNNLIQLAVKIDNGMNNYATIIYTGDKHNKSSKEISDHPNLVDGTFLPHCMDNTDGMNFIDEVYPFNPIIIDWYYNTIDDIAIEFASEIIIYKDDFDVFQGNKHTNNILKIVNPSIVFVFGVATNICVNAAMVGLAKRGYEVCLVIDAVKELPGISLDEVIQEWKKYRIKYISTIPYISQYHHAFEFYKKICDTYNHDYFNQSHILTLDKFIKDRFGD